jgi:hypothetical protein
MIKNQKINVKQNFESAIRILGGFKGFPIINPYFVIRIKIWRKKGQKKLLGYWLKR